MENKKIESLTRAFNDFTEIIGKFQKTYQTLQVEIRELNSRLEKKNVELQDKINESENIKNFLNSILEHIYSGVIVVDNSGQVTVFNKAAENITHIKKEDLLGKNYRSFFQPSNIEKSKSLLYTLATGKESHHRQKEITTSDGESKIVEFSTSIIRDINGEQLGVAEVFNDISELKKMQEKIGHIETLAALGEMAANVAHEIRNPLGGIGGFAGLLQRKLAKDDDRQKLVKPIITGVNRLNNIVSDLLTYTRPQKLTLNQINLNEILSEIVDFFRMSIESDERKNINIKTDFRSPDCFVYLDSSLFQQVVINFLKNAADAIDKEGNIIVRTESNIPTNMSDVLTDEEKQELLDMFSFVEISIIDDGSGIEPDIAQKLFNPFFTTKEDGNGLGLSICRKIINLHEGDIHVESKVNEGTKFIITIPIKKEIKK